MAEDNLGRYKMVVIGGSAGSLEIILRTVAALPQGSNASFVIVIHRKNEPDSILRNLLAGRTKLSVKEVEDKERIVPATVYLAPPDYHLLFEDVTSFSLDVSEKIHHSRPSIDVTFESAAEVYGAALIGILLSGANADGASGMKKIFEHGGHTIVQQPSSAEVEFMPQQALNLIKPNAVLPGNEIGAYLRNIL